MGKKKKSDNGSPTIILHFPAYMTTQQATEIAGSLGIVYPGVRAEVVTAQSSTSKRSGKMPLTVGERVKAYREEKKLSQVDLARLTQLSQATIASIETNRRTPGVAVLQKLAGLFGCPLEDLLD